MHFFSANVNICLDLGKWQKWSEPPFWYFLSWILTYLCTEVVILSLGLVFFCPLLNYPQIMLDIAIWIILGRSGKQKDFQRTILYFLPNLCDLVSSENWCLILLSIAEDQMWESPKSPIDFCFFELQSPRGAPCHPRSLQVLLMKALNLLCDLRVSHLWASTRSLAHFVVNKSTIQTFLVNQLAHKSQDYLFSLVTREK